MAIDSAPGYPLRWIDAGCLRDALSMEAAIDAVEAAFARQPRPHAPQRTVVADGSGQLLLMPAVGARGAGVKVVSVQPDNAERRQPVVQGVYVLLSAETRTPLAVIDGTELTRLRAPAVSAVATRHLARADARRLVVFGSGVQAAAHVEAMLAVRPIEDVTIVDPVESNAARLVEALLSTTGITARVGAAAAVAHADIVCTCTTAAEPVFDGLALAAGAHVNAIGSFQPHTREIDTATVTRGMLVLEDRDAVRVEAGDIAIPLAEGAIGASDLETELADVARGRTTRTADDQTTVFKSVGVGYEDLAVALAAYERVSPS